MIVHAPEVTQSGDTLRITARVESSATGLPTEAFLETHARHADELAARVEAFAPVLLLSAMFHREPLKVRAPISPAMARGLVEARAIINAFYPNEFPRVPIRARDLYPPPVAREGVAACGFSGGVDSLYTVWKHRPAAALHPTLALRKAIYAHGFNLGLEDRRYGQVAARLRPVLRAIGVELVEVRSNLRAFIQRADWTRTHGAAIASLGHLFAGSVRRLFIASSRTLAHPIPWGSDARLDPWYSSEAVEILHDENSRDRLGKIRALLDWPDGLRALHCCTETMPGHSNCGLCLTCVHTRACLRVAGWHGDSSHFAREWRDTEALRLTFPTASTLNLGRELRDAAWRQGDRSLAALIAAAIVRDRALAAANYVRHGSARRARMAWGRLRHAH